MKIGLKLWSTNYYWYDEAVRLCKENLFDYIELMYFPGEEKDIQKLSGIPIIIHAPTFMQGVHFSDGRIKKNILSFNQIIRIGNRLNAKAIIIHPDFGTEQNFINFLQKIKPLCNYPTIYIENMPALGIHQEAAIGYVPEQIKKFMEIGNYSFCLDFTHAVKAATSLKKDYKELIKEFLKLRPKMAHISGTDVFSEIDAHLDLNQGSFDLNFIKNSLKESKIEFLTLETPKSEGLKNDIKNKSLLDSLLL